MRPLLTEALRTGAHEVAQQGIKGQAASTAVMRPLSSPRFRCHLGHVEKIGMDGKFYAPARRLSLSSKCNNSNASMMIVFQHQEWGGEGSVIPSYPALMYPLRRIEALCSRESDRFGCSR